MNKKIKIILILVIVIILGFGIYYISDYSHSDEKALTLINGSENVSVTKTSNGLFIDGDGNSTALIFYPGAKIEYTSYLPLMVELAKRDIDCFLVEMPFNLAILNQNAADEILDNYNYTNYYMAGHSLGGAMASQYVHDTNKTNGLILLASYPTLEIQKPVLSIYGSEDKILNMEKYTESKNFMKNLDEVIIKGGNHAQMGNYGNQTGDGQAKITSESQQKQAMINILDFIKEINGE